MLRSLVILTFLTTSLPIVSAMAQSASDRTEVTFLFEENVSAADEYLIRESIRFAQDYMVKTFGADVQKDIVVKVQNNPSDLVNYAKNYTINVNTATFLGYPPLIRIFFLVHEYFHIWQQDAAGPNRNVDSPIPASSLGPAWLMEGSAEYIGLHSLLETGIVGLEEINERTVQMVNGAHNNGPPELGQLSQLLGRPDMIVPEAACCTYALSALGVKLLVGDQGPAALASFYRALGQSSKSWEVVFEESFGINVADFYAQFEAERSSLMQMTGLDVGQLLITPRFNDAPSAFSLGGMPDTVAPGDQVVLYGWSIDGSTCVMTVRDEGGEEITRYPTYADSYGLVVWLWSVPDSLPPGTLAVEMSCGGESIFTSLGMN